MWIKQFHQIHTDASFDFWMLLSLHPHLLTTGHPASLFLCFLSDSILQYSNSLSSNPFTLQLNLNTVWVYSPAWLIEWVGFDISGGRWDASWEVGHDPNIHSAINGQGITLGNSIKAQEAAKSSEQTTIMLDDRIPNGQNWRSTQTLPKIGMFWCHFSPADMDSDMLDLGICQYHALIWYLLFFYGLYQIHNSNKLYLLSTIIQWA